MQILKAYDRARFGRRSEKLGAAVAGGDGESQQAFVFEEIETGIAALTAQTGQGRAPGEKLAPRPRKGLSAPSRTRIKRRAKAAFGSRRPNWGCPAPGRDRGRLRLRPRIRPAAARRTRLQDRRRPAQDRRLHSPRCRGDRRYRRGPGLKGRALAGKSAGGLTYGYSAVHKVAPNGERSGATGLSTAWKRPWCAASSRTTQKGFHRRRSPRH
jgi:hypothetical protein